ncbi:MAG: RNA-binding transcriptional accessory protein, partial [Brachymonas sp.]|nr:RNA-binding transcriptional accessory protein [Brachymonas sp.]
MTFSIVEQIASEIRVQPRQVQTAIDLLDGGATVPFIARYRKEATDGLDDAQLRELEVRLSYLRELHERRAAILKSIEEQGKLTPELRAAIEAAPTKQELEDLYLPYKPKRRTKGQIAREFGIEPLADQLFADPTLDPNEAAKPFVKAEKGEGGEDFTTVPAVLDGVRDILSERWAEDAALVQSLREWLWQEGLLQSKLAAGKNEQDPEVAKFRDYHDYDEPIGRVPSHRALAVFRGRQLEILDAKLVVPEALTPSPAGGGQGWGQAAPAAGAVPPSQPSPNGGRGQAPSLAEGRIAQHLGWSHQ